MRSSRSNERRNDQRAWIASSADGTQAFLQPLRREPRRPPLWPHAGGDGLAAEAGPADGGSSAAGGLPGFPHFAPKAKRVIYLFQSGGPSQLELFDYKPQLEKFARPGSARFRAPRPAAHGDDGSSVTLSDCAFDLQVRSAWQIGRTLSELLPHTAKIADDLCFIKSMNTEQINHDPAITFSHTGFQLAGRPSLGAWVAYGLGSENKDLPAFVVMVSLGGLERPAAV